MARVWHRSFARVWLALLLLGVALSAPAVAATDYDPQSNAWNGLSQLESLASRVDVEIRHTRRLDFSTLKPSDALLLIYPKRELPAPALESFIRDGGRVIVADDFGRSEPFLRRFDGIVPWLCHDITAIRA